MSHKGSGSPSPTSPQSPKSPHRSPPQTPKENVTRERSGSWLGKFGEARRRSGSVQAPGSPVVTRASMGRSMSISLENLDQTVPDALGSLMFSPRADKLEGDFVVEDPSDVLGAKLINSSGLNHFYVATYKGEKVLQKVIKYRNIDDKVLASFEKEVAVLSTLSHKNIVRFIGAKATPPDLFMILEWMGHGSLSSILSKDLSVDISWNKRLGWMSDVAKGIEYLHSLKPKIIHRDLRSDNVMVNGEGVAKVSEFGLSRRKRFAMKASPKNSKEPLESPRKDTGGKGKEEGMNYSYISEGGPAFTAPELLLGKAYSEKVDAYNFGILMWQIMTRQVPHLGKSPFDIANGVVQDNLRPAIPDFVPEDLKTLIVTSWDSDEEKRMSFDVVVQKLHEIQKANLEPDLPTEDVESMSEDSKSEVKQNNTPEFNEFL